jgi:hypothetical protein
MGPATGNGRLSSRAELIPHAQGETAIDENLIVKLLPANLEISQST